MSTTCAGIILSGGKNSRMKGKNKAYLKIGGVRFLDRLTRTLTTCFEEILIVTKDPSQYSIKNVTIVKDILDVHSPLSGIHAGLSAMTAGYGFCVGCDTPFLMKDVIDILKTEIEPEADIVVPSSDTYFQPLCAIYAKQCAPLIEAQLNAGDLKVDHLYAKVRVKTVPFEMFQQKDKELISFFNVNTPDDLDLAEKLYPPR